MGWFGRVWAIARMTVIEASRRSVFWVLLLFAIWLLFSLTELPGHSPEARLRVIQAWSAQTITLFTTLVALFTVGFSLPSDFEEKRVYMLVSKPVEKVTLYLGRYLGFTLVLAILLLFMGMASVTYIRIVQWAGGPDFPPPKALPRIVAATLDHERGDTGVYWTKCLSYDNLAPSRETVRRLALSPSVSRIGCPPQRKPCNR